MRYDKREYDMLYLSIYFICHKFICYKIKFIVKKKN